MNTVTQINLSKTTLAILKNFATLNSNILVSPGNTIKTITPSMNGMAEASVEETFETEFGIWDLSKFLGVISLFTNPTFEFEEKSVRIRGSNDTVVNYYYSEPRLLTTPTKSVNMPEISIETNLTQDMFSELTRASSILQLPDISFQNRGDDIYVVVSDRNDPTSNNCEIKLDGSANGAQFNFNFKMDNIRLLPGNYKISFAKNIVGRFENENISLTYWFAMQPNSFYNG
jgi:hypothetical protein